MTSQDQAALSIYQRSRHLPTELRERILDNFFAAPANNRLSLEQFLEQQAAVAAVFTQEI